MQIGIRLSGAVSAPVDYDAIVRFALKADKFGIDSGWLSDHVIWPKPPHRCLEGWTVMTAVAARTEKLRLGFSMLNPSFRYPAVLAKMAATFDQISRGRLIFSLGTGYFSGEYHAYGVPFLQDRDDRAEYVQEVALACKQLWISDGPTNFVGKFVKFENCSFSPSCFTKPHPPIWFGGESDHTRRAVREIGQGWVMHLPGAKQQMNWVKSQTAWPQQPMTFAALTNIAIATSKDEALAKIKANFSPNPAERTIDEMLRWALAGTLAEVIQQIREIESWGINYLLLGCADEETIEVLGTEIVPAVAG